MFFKVQKCAPVRTGVKHLGVFAHHLKQPNYAVFPLLQALNWRYCWLDLLKALQKPLVFICNFTLLVLSEVESGSWNFFSELLIFEIGVQIFLQHFWNGPAWPCEDPDWVSGGLSVSGSGHDIFYVSKKLEILFIDTGLTIFLKLQRLSIVYLFNVGAIAEWSVFSPYLC